MSSVTISIVLTTFKESPKRAQLFSYSFISFAFLLFTLYISIYMIILTILPSSFSIYILYCQLIFLAILLFTYHYYNSYIPCLFQTLEDECPLLSYEYIINNINKEYLFKQSYDQSKSVESDVPIDNTIGIHSFRGKRWISTE
ncbi:hypothetical protein WA158_008051 [Blastocystis sp. Blastoise]